MHVCETNVPASARTILSWHTQIDIVHTIRNTVRYRKWGDYFCGTGGLGAAFLRRGVGPGAQLDLSVGGVLHNILTPEGFWDVYSHVA